MNCRNIELLLLTGILLIYSWATYQRNFIWETEYSLWQDVVKKSPKKARPYGYLGLQYERIGETDKAIIQYRKSLSLKPGYPDVHNNLGVCYFSKGWVDDAIVQFQHAIRFNPHHISAHYNLGIAYAKKGLYEWAFKEIERAKELSSKNVRSRNVWESIRKDIKVKDTRVYPTGHP